MAINFPKLIEMARKASKQSNHRVFSIGAVIFNKRGKILAVGCNDVLKTHPMIRRYHQHRTMHAEADAVLSSRHKVDLEGANILVYRENKAGELRLSRPCDTCQKILKIHGINKVYYTDENTLKYEEI